MTRKYARTRKPADLTLIPTKCGEQVTADHLVPNPAESQGVEGSAYAVVLSLQDFIGPRQTVSSFQCDGATELNKAAVEFGL